MVLTHYTITLLRRNIFIFKVGSSIFSHNRICSCFFLMLSIIPKSWALGVGNSISCYWYLFHAPCTAPTGTSILLRSTWGAAIMILQLFIVLIASRRFLPKPVLTTYSSSSRCMGHIIIQRFSGANYSTLVSCASGLFQMQYYSWKLK